MLDMHIEGKHKLKFIALGGNAIANVPNGICNFAQLNELYLDNNKISTLPSDFGKLTKLKVCHLAKNNIAELIQKKENLGNINTPAKMKKAKNRL